jgi:hypothetical protein
MTDVLVVPNAKHMKDGNKHAWTFLDFSKPHRLVLNKQLDIVKGVLASSCASDSNRDIVVSYSHAIEVGT